MEKKIIEEEIYMTQITLAVQLDPFYQGKQQSIRHQTGSSHSWADIHLSFLKAYMLFGVGHSWRGLHQGWKIWLHRLGQEHLFLLLHL